MIAQKDVAAEQAKAAGVTRVREMLEEMLPPEEREEEDGGTAAPGKDTSVIVNQLACMEAGCPDVEVVITLLRAKPRPKLMFKLYKAAADLAKSEVEAALQTALAEEQGKEKEHAHEHGHADDHGHADGHAGGDCCAHGHDDGHDHGHKEQSQATEKQHDHGHADGHAGGDCCAHGHDDKHDHGHDDKKHEHGHA